MAQVVLTSTPDANNVRSKLTNAPEKTIQFVQIPAHHPLASSQAKPALYLPIPPCEKQGGHLFGMC